jgi:predicted GIY-YIG superfamily endonuclease
VRRRANAPSWTSGGRPLLGATGVTDGLARTHLLGDADGMHVQTYGVYVIELEGSPNSLYVGYSYRTAEERLQEHLSGHNAAGCFKHGARGRLRPDLYEHLPRFASRRSAEQAVRQLAGELSKRGWFVEGGH